MFKSTDGKRLGRWPRSRTIKMTLYNWRSEFVKTLQGNQAGKFKALLKPYEFAGANGAPRTEFINKGFMKQHII